MATDESHAISSFSPLSYQLNQDCGEIRSNGRQLLRDANHTGPVCRHHLPCCVTGISTALNIISANQMFIDTQPPSSHIHNGAFDWLMTELASTTRDINIIRGRLQEWSEDAASSLFESGWLLLLSLGGFYGGQFRCALLGYVFESLAEYRTSPIQHCSSSANPSYWQNTVNH